MIAIIDYEAGNIGSVANALKRLGVSFEVTSDISKIKSSAGVIFPGQGRAGPAMTSLKKTGLDKLLPALKQPFLGICLGMQLMVEKLEEDDQAGLGILPGSCRRLSGSRPVPHIGWNQVNLERDCTLFEGLEDGFYQYFVHSYAVDGNNKYMAGSTDYDGKFASVLSKDNFYGVQFHPEKSSVAGEQILRNFLMICKKASTS